MSVMVLAGFAPGGSPPARGAYGETEYDMEPCSIPSLNEVECDGHLGKFDDCLAEALWEWNLEGADGNTGTGDFEGHTALIIVPNDSFETIDPDGSGRQVPVPAGAYLLFESGTGIVTWMLAESEQQAREVFEAAEARYDAWDHGCNADDLAGHQACLDAEGCLRPEWADA